MSTLHFTAVIKQILQPETDPSGQRPFVRNLYLVEEHDGGQYPERAILAVFDKDGNGSVWNKVLEKLGHFPAVEQPGVSAEPFELYFHLDASSGVSQRTGNPYSIQKPISAWYFDKPEVHEKKVTASVNEPCAYSIPGFNSATPSPNPASVPVGSSAPQASVPVGSAASPVSVGSAAASPAGYPQYQQPSQPQYNPYQQQPAQFQQPNRPPFAGPDAPF